jgi:hypothetical protein
MKLKLLEITNWLPIGIIYQLRNVMLSALRMDAALRRVKLKLLDTSSSRPIRIIYQLRNSMSSALPTGEAL